MIFEQTSVFKYLSVNKMTASKTLSRTFLLPQPGFSLNIFEQAVQDSTHLQPEAAKRNKQNNILLRSKSLSRVSVQS